MTYSNSDMIKAESLKSVIWEIPYLDGGGAVLSRLNELEKSLKAVQKELEQAPIKYFPPVGTYLYSENNPADTWTGTTWTQIEEGIYLTSAGSTYNENTHYGSNSITLTESHLPRHTHTGPSHSHTMAHTHTGPSHTHSVSGTAVSAGSHSHRALMRYGGDWSGNGQWSANSSNQSGNWYLQTESAGAHTHSVTGTAAASGTGKTGASSASNTGAGGTGSTSSTGGGVAFNNMPKSIAVSLWKRVS